MAALALFHGITEEHYMHIRTAHMHDAAAIATVHVESWRTTYKGIVPDDFLARLSEARREQLWRQVLADPSSSSFVYVAEDARGTVIGFVSGGPERSGDPVYTGELYAIYLLAQHQGQGIGRQLVITLVNRLLQDGMPALLLWVLAKNPARRFYERLGGRPVDDKTVTIGGVPLIEVAYGWRDARLIIEQPERPQPSRLDGMG
jgi:GNAT superfamily N-acetyltransferase